MLWYVDICLKCVCCCCLGIEVEIVDKKMLESKSRCGKKCEWYWNLVINFCLGGRESFDG